MLQKLLVLAAVVAVAWYGFKAFGRLDQQRKQRIADEEEAERKGISETVQCTVCDAYIAESAKNNCGRPDCPY